MTYKEFRTWAEGEGYRLDEHDSIIVVIRCDRVVGSVPKDAIFLVDTNYRASRDLTDSQRDELFCNLGMLPTPKLPRYNRF